MSTPPKTAVRRLAVARTISMTGDSAAFVALIFMIYARTGSALWLSGTMLATWGVFGLSSPFAGALGDRFDRRKVMIASDLVGAACWTAMAFARDPGVLLGIAAVAAAAEAPFVSASSAAIPNLVEEEELAWANGLVAMGNHGGQVLGPALGGVAVAALGIGWVFGANAVSFLVSAAMVRSVSGRFSGERNDEEHYRGARAGFVFLARDRVLRTITLAWVVFVLGLGMAVVADVPLARSFGAGSAGYGFMFASWGAGSVLGSFLGRRLSERTEARWLVIGTLVAAGAMGAVAASPWFIPILGFLLANGIGDGLTVVAEQGIRQRRTPDAVRGRVFAANHAIIQAAFIVAWLFAGVVLALLGPQGAYGLAATTAALAALVLLPVLRWTRLVHSPP